MRESVVVGGWFLVTFYHACHTSLCSCAPRDVRYPLSDGTGWCTYVYRNGDTLLEPVSAGEGDPMDAQVKLASFAVGVGGRKYPGFHPMPLRFFCSQGRAIRDSYEAQGGFLLLDPILKSGPLRLAEGALHIDRGWVRPVGYQANGSPILVRPQRYLAENTRTEQSWHHQMPTGPQWDTARVWASPVDGYSTLFMATRFVEAQEQAREAAEFERVYGPI